MGFQRFASFTVVAADVATADGVLKTEMGVALPGQRRVAHRHVFEYTPKPGFLYVRSRAISSRVNDNFDEFPAEEIKQAYATFKGKPVFVNHHNADHRRARGVIIDAALHEDRNPDGSPDTWVEVLMEVDAVRFPRLAEAVIKGHIDRTSMGTDVAYSVCTFCGNKAALPSEYCRHIPKMKGQRITRRTASGAQEAVLVAETCYGLGFFENSLLVEQPADPTAYTFGVDTRGLEGTTLGSLAKAASKSAAATEIAPVVRKHLGRCYELSGKRVAFGPDGDMFLGYQGAHLIHGTIQGDGMPALGHGWVEEPNGDVWEPGTNTVYGGADFKRLFNAKEHVRYTADEARRIMSRAHHFGPWDEEADAKSAALREVLAESEGPAALVAALADEDVTALSTTAMGVRDTPASAYGMHYDPAAEHDPALAQSRAFTGWDSIPIQDVDIADLVATEPMLSSESVNGHLHDPLPPGYYAHAVRTPGGRLLVSDGHHRVALTYVRGGTQMPVRILDLSAPAQMAAAKKKDRSVSPSETDDPDRYQGVSIKQDEKGYYVHTHRARSKSYPSPEQIPDSKIKFIESTGSLHVASGSWASDQEGEYFHYEAEGVGEATVTMEFETLGEESGGWRVRETGKFEYDAFRYDDLPHRLRGIAPSLADAKETCEAYVNGGQMTLGSLVEAALSTEAYGEQKAPAEVDTLRDDRCPICGDDQSFNGQKCQICGYVKPPAMFDDPDLDKAKQVDLRGGDVDGPADGAETLTCNHCGASYTKPGQAHADPKTPTPAGPSVAGPKVAAMPPWLKKKKDPEAKDDDPADKPDKADADKAETKAPPSKKVQPKQAPPADGETKTDLPVQDDAQDAQAPEQPAQGQPEQAQQPKVEVDPATLNAGDVCPTCGEGTLEPGTDLAQDPEADPDQTGVPSQDGEAEDATVVPDDQDDPDAGGDDDQQDPPDDGDDDPSDDDQDPAEDDSADSDGKPDDDKKSSKPPWLKEKKAPSSRRASRAHPKEASRAMPQDKNPAAKAREALAAHLASQERKIATLTQHSEALIEQVERQRLALTTLAKAAGISGHPRFAALVTAADEEGDEVATTTEQAVKPDGKDNPESVGASPAEVNKGVTPDATTDVQDSNVAVDAQPFNNLTDVTAPTPGSDNVPSPDQAAAPKYEVRNGTPSTEPFDNVGGWTAAKANGEDPQTRFMASLNLARLQIQAGIAEGNDLALGQGINDDATQSLATITAQIDTLGRVASARTASAPSQAQRSLVPQRQASRAVPSLTAGVTPQQSTTSVSADEMGFFA